MRALMVAALGAAALLLSFTAGSLAHEGHDHAQENAPPPPASAARGEASGTDVELVAVVRGTELLIYLDSFKTNEPLEGATIEAETPAGPAKAAPHAGQTYSLDAPWLAKPGKYDLIFTVTLNDIAEILPVTLEIPEAPVPAPAASPWWHVDHVDWPVTGGIGVLLGILLTLLTRRRPRAAVAMLALGVMLLGPNARADEGHVHADEPAKTAPVVNGAARERAQRLPDGTLFVPKDTQRIFGVRTIVTERKTHPRSIELPGRIMADPNASGFVQAAVGGRISAPPGGFPRLGTVGKSVV